ncbi:Os06g0103100 [Oryza sativa Japonica Group]|uniref:Os06g0103100 protein n=2 Tax=Oryza sativa subsp. japonica TaxID=39947 RepID=Q0DFC0_ORYSJ|nr:Os06g0103100 [Oryza sativa Japonica Group]BAS95714.1 Os06g0103100 [Oryza sativa Japonica Group]|eukprot:NP_001056539.1 Os06g0103100 [Oryza sativa Japonica Group]
MLLPKYSLGSAGWRRPRLLMAARHMVCCSAGSRLARVMHLHSSELSAWNLVSAAAPAVSPAARSSWRARSLSATSDSDEKCSIRSHSSGGCSLSISSDRSAYGSTTGAPSPGEGDQRLNKGGGEVGAARQLARAISTHALRKSQNAVPSESAWL